MRGLMKALSESELAVVRDTDPKELAALSEDELVELHGRVRRARTSVCGAVPTAGQRARLRGWWPRQGPPGKSSRRGKGRGLRGSPGQGQQRVGQGSTPQRR